MSKSVAIAVIHGIGSQGRDAPDDTSVPTFSKGLYKAVRKNIGRSKFDTEFAWREIFYSDATQLHQEEYIRRIKRKTRGSLIREFFINNVGDAAAYQYSPVKRDRKIYEQVHKKVESTFRELEKDTVADAPLIVIAHSLGGHVISNYIYDKQIEDNSSLGVGFKDCNRISNFITFGCNIPLFTFAWSAKDIKAIKYPGSQLPARLQQKPWWDNYYDKDDVLGFPLVPTGKGYKALYDAKELKDYTVNSGSLISAWNALSHTKYWTDSQFVDAVSSKLEKVLELTKKG